MRWMMAILNYTTKIPVEKTISEIEKMLADSGASKILKDYDNNSNVESISFKLMTEKGELSFKLPMNVESVLQTLKNQSGERKRDGLATGQKGLVLEAIRKFPGSCIREIAEITSLEKSSVSPRLNELRDNHLVYHSGFKVYKDKRVMTWKAN